MKNRLNRAYKFSIEIKRKKNIENINNENIRQLLLYTLNSERYLNIRN